MASAELSRRAEKLIGYTPLSDMGDMQRCEFHEALLNADDFEDLPGKWQAAIVAAEQNRPQQTVYEAAGGYQGLLRLAHAWHARVRRSEGRPRSRRRTATRPRSCGCTAVTAFTRRWIVEQSHVSMRR
jgi:hypothetical protein